jgi:metal-responsive CopG/Arc/MetJ family transcriptional regulator
MAGRGVRPRRLLACPMPSGYTTGMKTAVSVPNDVFERAESLAHREGRSRSEVYSAALREYVARHAPDEVTESIDSSLIALGDEANVDALVRAAASRVLESSEW